MAKVSSTRRSRNAIYLAGYFALLLITILGLALQGGAYYVLGATCIASAILGCFICYKIISYKKFRS